MPSLETATEAARLFAERATAAVDGCVVDDTNRSVLELICVRLDGIPLAIELAAAVRRPHAGGDPARVWTTGSALCGRVVAVGTNVIRRCWRR